MVFPYELFSGDYRFFYASDEDNFVFLIKPTTESTDTPEAKILEYEVVDTLGDDMLEAIDWKNGKMYGDPDSSCEEEHEMDYDS